MLDIVLLPVSFQVEPESMVTFTVPMEEEMEADLSFVMLPLVFPVKVVEPDRLRFSVESLPTKIAPSST